MRRLKERLWQWLPSGMAGALFLAFLAVPTIGQGRSRPVRVLRLGEGLRLGGQTRLTARFAARSARLSGRRVSTRIGGQLVRPREERQVRAARSRRPPAWRRAELERRRREAWWERLRKKRLF